MGTSDGGWREERGGRSPSSPASAPPDGRTCPVPHGYQIEEAWDGLTSTIGGKGREEPRREVGVRRRRAGAPVPEPSDRRPATATGWGRTEGGGWREEGERKENYTCRMWSVAEVSRGGRGGSRQSAEAEAVAKP